MIILILIVKLIYSTLPEWVLISNLKHYLSNLSSWHLFECDKITT